MKWNEVGVPRGIGLAISLIFTTTMPTQSRSQEYALVIDDIERSARAIGLRPTYVDCIRGGARTTPAMLDCADLEFAFQDKRLNKTYGTVMSSLGDSERSALRSEERKWLSLKAKKCALPDDPGSTDHVIAADCDVTETARRATLLEQRRPR